MTFHPEHTMTLPVELFTIPVYPITFSCLLSFIDNAIKRGEKRVVFALNLHIVAVLLKNPNLKKQFIKADRVFVDGVPLLWWSAIRSRPLPERISGTDLAEALLASQKRIFLLGSTQHALSLVRAKYHKSICGTASPQVNNSGVMKLNRTIIKKINASRANILLVGLGSPKQEQWILSNIRHLQIHVVVGVGGAFDIISGNTPRASRWMQKTCLEWAWRTYCQPKKLLPRYIKDIVAITLFLIKWIIHIK